MPLIVVPQVRTCTVSKVAAGSLIRVRDDVSMLLDDGNDQRQSIATFSAQDKRVIHDVLSMDQEVLDFGNDLVLQLSYQGAVRAELDMDAGLTAFINGGNVSVVLRLDSGHEWRLLHLNSATIRQPTIAVGHAFKFWRIGVRIADPKPFWLVRSCPP